MTVSAALSAGSLFPKEESDVICVVTEVTYRHCKLKIVATMDGILNCPLTAVLRRENIRLRDIDQLETCKCFRLHDIVVAKIMCFGDQNTFQLSTAKNEYGVISAICKESGQRMIPLSWCEMVCPISMKKESRKVAKVQPDFLSKIVGF
ncbi:MAG: Exosome complex component CSL4 [Paramarteilia canceri]